MNLSMVNPRVYRNSEFIHSLVFNLVITASHWTLNTITLVHLGRTVSWFPGLEISKFVLSLERVEKTGERYFGGHRRKHDRDLLVCRARGLDLFLSEAPIEPMRLVFTYLVFSKFLRGSFR